ncbi:MAG TPA: hypothetical protein DDW52_21395 [Planctomycetaceae bacterium]|nr:hypothetical protein [Planctomycetaceae bacterium]
MNSPNELSALLFAMGEKTSDPTGPITERVLDPSTFVPFGCSMETLAEHLLAHPHCYFEWDGSFSMSGFSDSSADSAGESNASYTPPVMCGMIYDSSGSIRRIELSGAITCAALSQLAEWLTVPPEQIAVQQLPTGKLSSLPEFRQFIHVSQP